MTIEERDRRRRLERQKRHRKIMRIRRIIKAVIYAVFVLIAFLVIWFAVRPAVAKLINRDKTDAETEQVSEVNTDPNAAVRKTLQDPAAGEVGWNVDSNGWWYKNDDATQFISGWETIDGQRYYFTENGYLATGWQTINGQDVYFDASGIVDESAHLKLVALTYDDGPSENTDQILDVLEANGAKATFFVVGTQIEPYPEELKREYEAGMEIGNHTYDHTTLSGSDPETITNVIDKNEELIDSVIGYTPKFIRPTGGGVDDNVIETVDQPMILWDVDTLDWETKDPQNTYKVVMDQVKDGSVILMHDLYKATADATELIVPALKEQGYKMVTISELAEKYGYTLEPHYRYYDFYPDEQALILKPDGTPLYERDEESSSDDSSGDASSEGSSDDSSDESSDSSDESSDSSDESSDSEE